MQFFDCNAYFGRPAVPSPAPGLTVDGFLEEMAHNGVQKALVWHVAQYDAAPQAGNILLSNAIRPHPNLTGCWTLLPDQCHEFPPFNIFVDQMRAARVAALRVFPQKHHFLLNKVAMGSWLEPITELRIPLFLSVGRGADWEIAYALLSECPDLTCVICDHGCWGEDRRFRPLIGRYPNVFIDTSQYLLDGGIEDFVERYGPGRMLFGTDLPWFDPHHAIGVLLSARISDEDRHNICHRNAERLLAPFVPGL